ncbi:MAG: hypothetical protein MUO52_19425, partial [Desulfobacterales bacterium]|nr:hypothetical protein [Desulfobacterales bacterium]
IDFTPLGIEIGSKRFMKVIRDCRWLPDNRHLQLDGLTAPSGSASLTVLSKSKDKAEGLCYPHPPPC